LTVTHILIPLAGIVHPLFMTIGFGDSGALHGHDGVTFLQKEVNNCEDACHRQIARDDVQKEGAHCPISGRKNQSLMLQRLLPCAPSQD
jgi:hypothetical protein